MEKTGERGAATVTALQAAVRDLKIANADSGDVVVDMKEADRARLSLLADSLADVIAEVPTDDDRFDFVISSGLQPRFWIDATAHVMMGRDRRVYKFVRDTRLGRIVLAESLDRDIVTNAVTQYVAERLLERERVLAGETVSLRPDPVTTHEATQQAGKAGVNDRTAEVADKPTLPVNNTQSITPPTTTPRRSFGGLGWVLAGLIIGGGLVWLWANGQLG